MQVYFVRNALFITTNILKLNVKRVVNFIILKIGQHKQTVQCGKLLRFLDLNNVLKSNI